MGGMTNAPMMWIDLEPPKNVNFDDEAVDFRKTRDPSFFENPNTWKEDFLPAMENYGWW